MKQELLIQAARIQEGIDLSWSVSEEEIMRSYIKSERYEAVQEATQETTKKNAIRLLKLGKINLSDLPVCFPELGDDDIKELEEELMQLS